MALKLIDTHSHIHFSDYPLDADEVWADARESGVEKMLVVGCDVKSSKLAVEFARQHKNVFAVVGVHPHLATKFLDSPNSESELEKLLDEALDNKIVAVGEFGLDYYYDNSPREDQIKAAKYQLGLAQKYDLPLCLHIRDAFEDFWPIFDEFNAHKALKGVVHSFTAADKELTETLDRGLLVALNGIITFTKDEKQLETAKKIPIHKLLLETDAPFLTPKPFRGKVCKPEHVVHTAEFLAELRGEAVLVLSDATTKNATELFKLIEVKK